jgi:phenylalanyl-tRNA synthetase alpha chain
MTVIPIEETKQAAEQALVRAGTPHEVRLVKAKYLGRCGIVSEALKRLRSLSLEARPEAGRRINALKAHIEELVARRLAEVKQVRWEEDSKTLVDITLPGRAHGAGRKHPVSQTLEEMVQIFSDLGFKVAEGPEVELDYYNFAALNIPRDHPARDMQATFYISDDVVLRTHTSPVQVRVMEKYQPPISVISPGKAYRCDADVSHSPMFHQLEGFTVDHHISFAHLKGVLVEFARRFFGPTVEVRFRPSFFPFTEPSAEMDIRCVMCKGAGCRVCSHTGWLEILGSGMIDPAVYAFVGYDPEVWTGFAFGMGVERLAMLRYGIDDIRLFFENDIRFLHQF